MAYCRTFDRLLTEGDGAGSAAYWALSLPDLLTMQTKGLPTLE